jgi:hypothetical protein
MFVRGMLRAFMKLASGAEVEVLGMVEDRDRVAAGYQIGGDGCSHDR